MGNETGPFGRRVRLHVPEGPPDVVRESEFPPYAYGVLQAAVLAHNLGIPAITVAELGVAGGNGLVELERLGARIGESTGVDIAPVGFDLGTGMPDPRDYRDMPYIWQRGFFTMDETQLRSKLHRAELVTGDIGVTGAAYLRTGPAPIGFLSFDLDYYSSTAVAMNALLDGPTSRYLPRVFCYFDDTVGPHAELHSPFTGELLAIDEFNASRSDRKLAPVHGLRYKLLPFEGPWVAGFYVLHVFEHKLYGTYVFHEDDRQFPLGS